MKICRKPWDHFYVVDAEHGQIWPCAWLNMRGREFCLGNILEQSVDGIYHSDMAKKFRDSIADGSYRYCSVQECAYLANDTLPELSDSEVQELMSLEAPEDFVLAYEETCNHACISCRKDYYKGSDEYYKKIDLISEKLLPYLNRARRIDANGRGELFASEHMLRMLEQLRPGRDDFSLNIETNASLFDERHFSRLMHLAKYNITVIATVNSFHDSTYRYLNGYANHVDQVIDNLRYIRRLREHNIVNKLTLSMVVQESNFRELPEWTRRCLEEFGADAVRVRGIMQFSMNENDFWFKDVFNPAHPFYREALDILHDPIMQDERVWFWEGDYEHVRKPRELPVKRFEQNYNLLWKLVGIQEEGELENIITKYQGKRLALYGAGKLSEYLVCHLPKGAFSHIYDSNKGKYEIGGGCCHKTNN